ncbi:heavy-metal-associated domain-containing protein [Candidatus Bathyarchaeota archaeon]|nr:heavy-metal-associated domain-containing protein [Candidatus Bathyarchaeota archaeon]
MTQVELKVKGMTCSHCEMRVKKALEKVEGVASAKADHKAGKAWITLKPGAKVDKQKLVDAVNATELYEAQA